MGYDLQPLVMIEEKKRILELCRDQKWRIAFEHDVQIAGSALQFDEKGRPSIGEVLQL